MTTAANPQPIRVLLVDDQPLLRMGFRMFLEAQDDISIVGEADDGTSAISRAAELRPDVVLMDVRMPGVNGIEATEAIVATGLVTKILILTTFDLDDYVYAALRAGANGFLLKDIPPVELLSAIRAVAAGDSVIAPTATRRLIATFVPMLPSAQQGRLRDDILTTLTDREQEVFGQAASGATNREIAGVLHMAESTVKVHIGRILAKLQLRDRVQIVVLAYDSGLVTPNVTPGQRD